MSDADGQLLQRMQNGEAAAFDMLFLRYYDQVYRVAYGVVGRHDLAEDLVQDTFVVLLHQPPTLADDERALPWLCRVALNRGLNTLRGERRAQARNERAWLMELAEEPGPEHALLRAETQAQVRDVLAELPERQMRLLLLRHAGLSYAEIAATLELAPGSVGTLLARAEKAFAAAFKQTEVVS